jgi:nucleoside-diphosphate-sugar epimerase
MRVLVVGSTGTIGKAVAAALARRHEVVGVSRSSTPGVDVQQPESVRALFRATGPLDAVVSATGQARFAPLAELDDEAFAFSLANKLMGQVNLEPTA